MNSFRGLFQRFSSDDIIYLKLKEQVFRWYNSFKVKRTLAYKGWKCPLLLVFRPYIYDWENLEIKQFNFLLTKKCR